MSPTFPRSPTVRVIGSRLSTYRNRKPVAVTTMHREKNVDRAPPVIIRRRGDGRGRQWNLLVTVPGEGSNPPTIAPGECNMQTQLKTSSCKHLSQNNRCCVCTVATHTWDVVIPLARWVEALPQLRKIVQSCRIVKPYSKTFQDIPNPFLGLHLS